jgi:hypothetical protein
MKKLIVSTALFYSFNVSAQKIDFSLGLGTGKSYIFESTDNSINVKYGLPLSLNTSIKYTPANKNWGIKLNVLQIQSTLKGTNWVSGASLNGYANTITTSLLLENEIVKKQFNYGFNFGLGLTKESIQEQQFFDNSKSNQNFASLIVGGYFSKKINKNFDFEIAPTFLWQDPFKTIGYLAGSRNANFAGEDLSVLVNFNIKYKIFNK